MTAQRFLLGVAGAAVGVLVVMACVMTWVTMRAVVATAPTIAAEPPAAAVLPPPAPLAPPPPPPMSEGERIIAGMRVEAIGLRGLDGSELESTLEQWSNSAADVSYGMLERSPDSHVGDRVVFSGRVLEIHDLPDGGTFLRLGTGSYGSDPVWVEAFVPPDESVVANSRVRVYGYLTGPHTYTSEAGWNITIPSMLAVAVVPRRR